MCSEYSISLHLIWAIKIPGFKPHQLLDQHQTHFCLDKFVICWRRNTHIFSHPYDDSFLNGCYQNAFLRFLLPHIFSRNTHDVRFMYIFIALQQCWFAAGSYLFNFAYYCDYSSMWPILDRITNASMLFILYRNVFLFVKYRIAPQCLESTHVMTK